MYKLLKKRVNIDEVNLIAKKLSSHIGPGDIILLKGPLGAGKTTFVRFAINSIYENNSLKKPNLIKSPSFPILINYPINNFEIFHYDFYRIKKNEEFLELNFYENIKDNISFVEWPDIIIKENKIQNFYIIKIEIIDLEKRIIEINQTSSKLINYE